MNETTISRRDFLTGTAWASAVFGFAPWINGAEEQRSSGYMAFNTTNYAVGWSAPADLVNVDPIVLVLNRITFGPRPGDLERVASMGLDHYIEEQLSPERIDDSALDPVLKLFTSLNMTAAQLGQLYAQAIEQQRVVKSQGSAPSTTLSVSGIEGIAAGLPGRGLEGNGGGQQMSPKQVYAMLTEVIQATVLRQMFSQRQLLELLVDFWSNHFNIYILKNQDRFLKTVDDREVIRKHAFGKFGDLLSASAHSPAMLVYLDNITNVKGVPNENYARELMELHTLGVNGGYSQADVQQVARCFTGWSTTGPRRGLFGMDYGQSGEFQFRPNQHDNGEKLVLGITIPSGGGVHDAEQVIEILAKHPSTAEFIATKLVRRFVADEPAAGLVRKAATAFTTSDGDIQSVLSTILHSDEFKSSFGQKAKRPLEFVAAAVRALDGRLQFPEVGSVPQKGGTNGPAQAQKGQNAEQVIANALHLMGQVPFMWEGPNGYPDVANAWINSNNLLARWNFAFALAAGQARGIQVDLHGPMNAAGVYTPEAAVDFWIQRVLHRSIPDPDRAKLLAYLGGDISEGGIAGLAALIISSPHFQYR